MLLFQKEHVEPILKGVKIATRRIWKIRRVKIGGEHQCKLNYYKKSCFARIKITGLYKQRLGDMKEDDAKKEGYNTLEE